MSIFYSEGVRVSTPALFEVRRVLETCSTLGCFRAAAGEGVGSAGELWEVGIRVAGLTAATGCEGVVVGSELGDALVGRRAVGNVDPEGFEDRKGGTDHHHVDFHQEPDYDWCCIPWKVLLVCERVRGRGSKQNRSVDLRNTVEYANCNIQPTIPMAPS